MGFFTSLSILAPILGHHTVVDPFVADPFVADPSLASVAVVACDAVALELIQIPFWLFSNLPPACYIIDCILLEHLE